MVWQLELVGILGGDLGGREKNVEGEVGEHDIGRDDCGFRMMCRSAAGSMLGLLCRIDSSELPGFAGSVSLVLVPI